MGEFSHVSVADSLLPYAAIPCLLDTKTLLGGTVSFPQTNVGASATVNCPSGYSGTITRSCSVGPSWGDASNSGCSGIVYMEVMTSCFGGGAVVAPKHCCTTQFCTWRGKCNM